MTDITTRPPATELVDTYFEMWRATDPDERASLVARSFTPDGRHVDPGADVTGHEQLAAMLAAAQELYPGCTLERTSGVDQHGNHVRFTWHLIGADGNPLLVGLDAGEIAPDGRFAHIASFWGDLPTH